MYGNRVQRSLALRLQTAERDALIPAPFPTDNGDESRYADKCGTYSKGILQDAIGRVNLEAYQTFKKALNSGDPRDFEAIRLGGPRTLNGPQGGLAFALEGLESSQYAVPPAPPLASDDYATELVELYWASLLRDVAFTDYADNAVAAQAAQELSSLPTYRGPRDANNAVTPALLFRGAFQGETVGPYVSQCLLQNTSLGALPLVQQYVTNTPKIDYMTDIASFFAVQNGRTTGQTIQPLKQPVYLHDGRGFAAWTHVDVLYQAYFMAYLVLNSVNAPLNPGNPYVHSRTQNGFTTMGQPDIASTLAAVASQALKAVWYQKWFVHLRHRPESGGGLVHLVKTGKGDTVLGTPSDVVLNSQAVQASFEQNNSYFLSQAFPEGSPTHPAYPTGHGTVAGACITVLKFFFDGTAPFPNAVVPSSDGSALLSYQGADADQLTVNGELNKLAHNISFGHGIHAGIHWRSDTDTSLQLGEAVALSVLQDRVNTYNERFTINLTTLDGSVVTISNQ